jgi:iron complex outermembrane receptor protein
MSGRFKAVLAAGISVAGLLSSPETRAQAAGTAGGLEEIVVTARRQEEALQSTPVAVSALTGASLDRLNVRAVDQIGAYVPNLAMAPTVGFVGGSTSSIRGIGEHEVLATADSGVGQYLDGVYISGLTATNFDLVDVERIEVLRGPQGTLFGRNTTGGAISIVTRQPSDDFGLQEKLGYASFNEFSSRTEVNSGLIGSTGLKAIAAFQHRRRDGVVDNINQPDRRDPGALRSDAVWLKLHGEWDALKADYSFDYNSLGGQTYAGQIAYVSPAIAAYYAQSPLLGGNGLIAEPGYRDRLSLQPLPDQKVGLLGHALTLHYELDDTLSLKSISGYRQYWAHMYVPYAPPGLLGATVLGVQPVTPFEGDNRQRIVQKSQELQLLGSTERWKTVVGLYYFHNRANEDELANLTFLVAPTLGVNVPSLTTGLQRSTSEAAFGQASYKPPILDDRLELTGGLRFTHDSKSIDQSAPIVNRDRVSFNNLSYNATASFQWTPELMTYVRIGSGYKSGGFNFRAQPGQNLRFAPEKATVYEGGLKSEWLDRRLRLNAAGFYTDYRDLQVSQYTGATAAGGNAAGVKNANAHYSGFELEVQAKPAAPLLIEASIGYVRPRYDRIYFPDPVTGVLTNYAGSSYFPYVPEWTNHVGIQYELPPVAIGRVILRGDYSYQSGKHFFTTSLPNQNPFNELIASPSQNLVSARITLTDMAVWNGRLAMETSLWGENLLNEHYLIQGVDFGPALGFATKTFGLPRRFGVDVRVSY